MAVDAVVRSDPPEFEFFMNSTLVGVLPFDTTTCIKQEKVDLADLPATMENAVWCIINISLCSNSTPNVLALGYTAQTQTQTQSQSPAGARLDNCAGVHSLFPNTTQNYLLTKSWDRLLERIGLFVHTLMLCWALTFTEHTHL